MRDELKLVILIPLLGALATGAFVGLLVLSLAAWQGWPYIYSLIATAGAALLGWLAWSARFAGLVEYRIAPDLRPGRPDPDKEPKEINLRIHEEKGEYLEGAFLDRLPVDEDNLIGLARRVVTGQALTTSSMIGSGLSRPTWEALRDRFVSAGLLTWRNGNRQFGVICTSRGLAVFRRMASNGDPD